MPGINLPSPYPFPSSLSPDLSSPLLLSHAREHLNIQLDHLKERQHHQQLYQLDSEADIEKKCKQEISKTDLEAL